MSLQFEKIIFWCKNQKKINCCTQTVKMEKEKYCYCSLLIGVLQEAAPDIPKPRPYCINGQVRISYPHIRILKHDYTSKYSVRHQGETSPLHKLHFTDKHIKTPENSVPDNEIVM